MAVINMTLTYDNDDRGVGGGIASDSRDDGSRCGGKQCWGGVLLTLSCHGDEDNIGFGNDKCGCT